MVVIESFGSALKDKNIAIEVSLEGTSPINSADRSQMEQVLSNIMKNSIESVANNPCSGNTYKSWISFYLEYQYYQKETFKHHSTSFT